MKRLIKKMYRGHISLRSYEVDKAIKKDQSIIAVYDGVQMTISVGQMKIGKQFHTKKIQSKYSDQTFELIDFEWKPDNKDELKLAF